VTGPKFAVQRSIHARELLATVRDAWIDSTSANGEPYLIPLTYQWDGTSMFFSTPEKSRTGRDFRRNPTTRASLPSTRDVVILDGSIRFHDPAQIVSRIDAFVAQHEWDPRLEPNRFASFTFTPGQVQAWAIASELPTLVVMRDGVWLDGSGQPQ